MKILINIALVASLLIINVSAYAADTKLVVLVRHAEKLPDGQDPSLSSAGYQRANALAEALNDSPLQLLLATQFNRTQQTLAPIAQQRNLTVQVVPAKKPIQSHIQAIVERVNQAQGNVLIAGHSNTVPLIIKALGGQDVTDIAENDYDNLYILSITPGHPASLISTRYGQVPQE